MTKVSIDGTGGSISIDVRGHENIAATNDSDANWLLGRFRVSAGSFSGEADFALTTQDLARFERELTEVLRILHGKITFQTDEEGLSFEIEMSARGTAKVVGFAKADGESKATLQFSFETDQSYLAETKRALTEMVKHFPVQKLHAR